MALSRLDSPSPSNAPPGFVPTPGIAGVSGAGGEARGRGEGEAALRCYSSVVGGAAQGERFTLPAGDRRGDECFRLVRGAREVSPNHIARVDDPPGQLWTEPGDDGDERLPGEADRRSRADSEGGARRVRCDGRSSPPVRGRRVRLSGHSRPADPRCDLPEQLVLHPQ